MKPKSKNNQSNSNSEQKEFVPIIPEEGLEVVHIGAMVYLGEHKKLPKFAKDNAGNREKEDDGVTDKVLFPKEGKDIEQRVALYVDLLNQTHNYGEDIGEKNIRLPLHTVVRGMSEGISLTTVAPRNPKKEYIKGIPWSYAGNSIWNKVAKVTTLEDGKTKVEELMCDADYKNQHHNDTSLLLGRPFMMNLEVKVTEKDNKKYVNTKLKSPVPLVKGIPVPKALIAPVEINFDDTDLLEKKDELGGACKLDLLRMADLRKIVIALDYEGSNMQKAIRQVHNEADLIKNAKETQAKIIETDKDLKEIRELYPEKFGGDVEVSEDANNEDDCYESEDEDTSEAPF